VRFAQRCRDVDGVAALPVLIEEEADQRSVLLFAGVELGSGSAATAMEGRGATSVLVRDKQADNPSRSTPSRYTGKKKLAKYFKNWGYAHGMGSWGFLTNHARVLLCIADDPGARLRDISATLGITERSAHTIVTDLIQDGYVNKAKDGRRNRYQIRAERPLPEPASRQPTIGELVALLGHTSTAPEQGRD
jgi:hypothetical protein